MNFIELQECLQKLTERKITQSDFARILNVGRANISDRIKRGSQVNTSELEKIQDSLGVKLYARVDDNNIKICDNSGERQNDTTVDEKSAKFGLRLVELQEKHNFLDREMAQLLKISEKEYLKLALGKLKPDLDILNRIKQNFKVSIDYLLYGE